MSTSGSVEDIAAVVTRLSKELELMGLPGLASQQDEHDGAIVDVIGLINASYDLIGLIRDLQRSKRQREDHAQQLLHDLQRSQWLLDKEKELTVQREREAAEACEKERQANVRLQLAETLLKKKTEENRQLVHECQLKENQWVHAIRRRDQDNHRLHQQLLKFLRTKPATNATSGSGKTGFVPLEMEIRGSLAPPRIVGAVSRSETPTRRKQWDKTVDDSRKLVEVKWKSALNSLEKDHQLLRVDYLQLVDMVCRFLTNCSAKMSIRRTTTTTIPNPLNSNITEWIQLPVNSMRDRLEDVFRLVEDSLQPATMSISGHSLDASAGYEGGRTRNENVKQSEPTTTSTVARENCYSSYRGATVDDWLNPIMKDDAVVVTPPSYRAQVPRSSQQTSGTGKSILRSEPTTHEQQQSADGLLPLLTDPCAFPKATEGNEPLDAVANQIDWNQATKMDNSDFAVYVRQNTVIVRKPTNGALSASAPAPIESETNDEEEDEIPSDVQQQITLDTPCPSRRGSSSSSSSSSSSWKSQSSANSREIDERFFRACTDAASNIVNPRRRPSASSTTVSLNGGGSITAKVSFVQHTRD